MTDTSISSTQKELSEFSKEELVEIVHALKKELLDSKEKSMGKYVDQYIDELFENNKKDVDIGVIDIGGICKVDILPDSIEKHIYKKTFKILISLLMSVGKKSE